MSNQNPLNTETDTQLTAKADRFVIKNYRRIPQEKLIEFCQKVVIESGKHTELQELTTLVNNQLQAYINAQTAYDIAKNLHNQDAKIIAHNHLNKALDNLADEINHLSHEINFLSSTGFDLNNDSHTRKMPDPVQSLQLLDIMQPNIIKLKIVMLPHSHYNSFKIQIHCEDGTETTETSSKKTVTLRNLKSAKSYTIKAAAVTSLSQEREEYNYCQPIKVIVQ
ncbi:MAG: hypothetical protein FE834_00325 [Gammaproteobacteria bacterium]|nr:hypothetical protein [Gammaproteobacteria bacterium]